MPTQDDPVWVEALRMLAEDLLWLLQLDHHKFWYQVSLGEGGHMLKALGQHFYYSLVLNQVK